MSLPDWLANGWLVAHTASRDEVEGLVAVVDRELADAAVVGLSVDAQLTHTYSAGLQLATIALAAAGYRPGRQRAHERTIQSLAFTVGSAPATVDLFDLVRRKRNNAIYEQVGTATATEVAELKVAVKALRGEVKRWLKHHHPSLSPR